MSLTIYKEQNDLKKYITIFRSVATPFFRVIETLVRLRHDRIYIPEEYERMIITARKKIPFTVKEIRHLDILDFKNWWPLNYEKTCSISVRGSNPPRTETFTVSNYRQFLYESDTPGYVTTWEYIGGLLSSSFKLLKPNKTSPLLRVERAYHEPVPINIKKVIDIKKVMQYVTGEDLEFYYHITSWKTTGQEAENDI